MNTNTNLKDANAVIIVWNFSPRFSHRRITIVTMRVISCILWIEADRIITPRHEKFLRRLDVVEHVPKHIVSKEHTLRLQSTRK
jgi:hypothetical protein